jgi:hypothetical protein
MIQPTPPISAPVARLAADDNWRASLPESALAASALGRLALVAPLAALFWAGVYWAAH